MNDYNALEGKGKETIRKPFRAFLDIGLTRITTGNKVFGCMKGCVDAGINIPHSVKKFPGFKKVKGNKKGEYDSEVHSARIHGIHIDEYWGKLEETDAEKAKAHFAKWQACLDKNKVESIPDLFTKVVEAIKKDPKRSTTKKKVDKPKRQGDFMTSNGKKWLQLKKTSKTQKKKEALVRIQKASAKMIADN